jgi:HAD superfamily hydrolase (TIGR01509 family)
MFSDVRAFPGAAALVTEVHDLGMAVVLATSAPDDELAHLRQILDADAAIDGVTTADQVASSKPDPEVFITAMESSRIDPRRAVAVGDSIWDVKSARSAGIACVTVETGGFSRHELSEAGSLAVYRDVSELLSQLRTSPIALVMQ